MANEKLEEGIAAFRAGAMDSAREIFAQLATAEPKNEAAWLWLAACLDDAEKKRYCLTTALELNPDNAIARDALAKLRQQIDRPSLDEITASSGGIVTLSCPSCGGSLKITDDMERFACTYCGREHLVRRSGRTVSLAPVLAVLSSVQASAARTQAEVTGIQRGVDRTAARLSGIQKGVDRASTELTISRLRTEIAALEFQKQRKLPSDKLNQSIGSGCLFGIGALALGLYTGWSFATEFGIVALGLTGLTLLLVYGITLPIDRQIEAKKHEIDVLLRSLRS